MEGAPFEEAELFRAIAKSGAPALPDLILTKRLGGRPKDFEDIRLLEALQREEET